MFAFEIPNMRFSLPAGATVAQHRFVAVSNSAGIQCTASAYPVGASMNAAASGKVLEIADGLVTVEAAGAIVSGAAVYSDGTGKAASSGTIIVGTAITAAAAAGDLITVKM